MDVRDALKAGKRTVIVSTGASSPTVRGSRSASTNYVLRANCDAIAL